MIEKQTFPRAALIGNPSDGFFGKTIAFVFKNFSAKVTLTESDKIQLVPSKTDMSIFEDIEHFEDHYKQFGYYGGHRLLKATIRKFFNYCSINNLGFAKKNFLLSYDTDIPVRCGLAGSSAIIIATLRALMEFYQARIDSKSLAELALSVETDELGIQGGLQDRIAQVYEKPVFMDFSPKYMGGKDDRYRTFSKAVLPPLYIAYQNSAAEGSEKTHNNLRERFDNKEHRVIEVMKRLANLTQDTYERLSNGEAQEIHQLVNENFDLRASIINISDANKMMISMARSLGASAKFTGSGGAIIGTYENEEMFDHLNTAFRKANITCIKPQIVE